MDFISITQLLLVSLLAGPAVAQLIYTDRLAPGISSWSYTYTALDLAATSQPRIGTNAIRSKLGAWGAVSLHRDAGLPWTSTSWLGMEFWATSDAIASLWFTLGDEGAGKQSVWVPVTSLAVYPAWYAGQPNETIPSLRKYFASFHNGTKLVSASKPWRDTYDRVFWFDGGGRGMNVVIDQVRLIARPVVMSTATRSATRVASSTLTRTRTRTRTATATRTPTRTPTWTRVTSTSASPTRTRTVSSTIPDCASAPPSTNTAAILPTSSLAPCESIRLDVGLVDNFLVDRYTWRDASNLVRSISMARYDAKNGNRGGFVVQSSYFDATVSPPSLVTMRMPARSDSGFGYVVSHEYYRTFTDGTTGTIAGLHGEDDSPLGMYLTASATGSGSVNVSNGTAKHVFEMLYPRWGTVNPVNNPWDPISKSSTGHKRYLIPVKFGWTITAGKDEPRFFIRWDLNASTACRGCIAMDSRAPYGVLQFDGGKDQPINALEWSDKYRFRASGNPLTTQSTWTWNSLTPVGGKRYNLLVTSGGYEMGLVQSIPYTQSRLGSPWSASRGFTSVTQNGCPDAGWKLPCDWSWTYQSINYELGSSGTTGKKMAWGTSYMLGQLGSWDDIGDPVTGWPAVEYAVDVVWARRGGAKTAEVAGFAGVVARSMNVGSLV